MVRREDSSWLDVKTSDNAISLYLNGTCVSHPPHKSKFREENPELVQMYVCGVTVYDYSHIGVKCDV